MRCIDPCFQTPLSAAAGFPVLRLTALAVALLLAGCGNRPGGPPATPTAPITSATPSTPSSDTVTMPTPGSKGSRHALVRLPAPQPARDWAHFKRLAALRMVAANPDIVYDGPVPDPLLAIPVLEIELGIDGHVRHIHVLRQPTQARETTQMAIDAVFRAAPFGPMAHLPQPWKFAEVFLFDDNRRFKPRTLDE